MLAKAYLDCCTHILDSFPYQLLSRPRRVHPPSRWSVVAARLGRGGPQSAEGKNHLSSLAAPGSPRARLLRKPSYTPTKGPCRDRDLTTQGRRVPEVPGSSGNINAGETRELIKLDWRWARSSE